MKFAILLSLFLFATSLLIGQSLSETATNTFEQKLDSVITQKSLGENYLLSVYCYDTDDNLLSYESYIWYNYDWFLSGLYSYSYDDQGNQVFESFKRFDEFSGGEMDYSYELEYTYNEDGKVTSRSYYNFFIRDFEEYEQLSKTNYEYDDSDEYLLSSETSIWDESSNTWKNNNRYEYEYDNNGNQLCETYSVWDENSGEWVYSTKVEREYIASGDVVLKIGYRFSVEGLWQNYQKNEYNYNSNGDILEEVIYLWDDVTSSWDSIIKSEYHYDEFENLILLVKYDGWGGSWENDRKEEFTYDANNYIASHIDFIWGFENGVDQWNSTDKDEYIFDENGNVLVYMDFNWDYFNDIWEKRERVEYEYDYELFVEDVLFPEFEVDGINNFSYPIINVPVKHELYRYDDDNWALRFEGTYYYSRGPSNIFEVPLNSMNVFPNPSSKFMEFDIADASNIMIIILYNLNGKEVFRQNGPGNIIDVSILSGGIYLYKVYNRDEVFTGKIIVE